LPSPVLHKLLLSVIWLAQVPSSSTSMVRRLSQLLSSRPPSHPPPPLHAPLSVSTLATGLPGPHLVVTRAECSTRLTASLQPRSCTARTTRTVHATCLAFSPPRTIRAASVVHVLAQLFAMSTTLLRSAAATRLAHLDLFVMLSHQEHTACAVSTAPLTQQLSGAHGQPLVEMLCARAL